MEYFLHREISHHLVKNVYEVTPGFTFLTNTLKLGLRFAERRPQRLDLVRVSCVHYSSTSVSPDTTTDSSPVPSPSSSSGMTRATAVSTSPSSRLTSLTP